MEKDLDEELERCKKLIQQAYEGLSIIPYATRTREYNKEEDGDIDFTHVYLRHIVPKKWFTSPTHIPDVFCSQLGRHLAIGEENFLIKKIKEYAETSPIKIEFRVYRLADQINSFVEAGFNDPVVFAPMKFYMPIATWGLKELGRSVVDLSSWPHILLLDEIRVPIFYSSKYVEFTKFMIVDKTFATWIFRPGNVTELLSVEAKPDTENAENLDILVVTKAYYKKGNPQAIIELLAELPNRQLMLK